MLLYINERAAREFHYRTSADVHGITRRYYCAGAPHRAILVVHGNLDLSQLYGLVVDANVGWDDGWREFVREGNTGKRHTKIMIRRVIDSTRFVDMLAAVLQRAPKDND